jgi:hypothetical protein
MPLYLETILHILKKLPPKGISILSHNFWERTSICLKLIYIIVLSLVVTVEKSEVREEFEDSDDESASSSSQMQQVVVLLIAVLQ